MLAFGDFELDLVSGELRRSGRPVVLQAKLHAILFHLVQHRDRWVSREQLLAHVWPGVTVSEAAVASALHDLRVALVDTGRSQALIQTARGRGYRFVAAVEERAPVPVPFRRSPAVRRDTLVGRDDVVAALEAALEGALAGDGRMVLLSGDAGIGKTRTAYELLSLTRARGIPSYAGSCTETGGAPAFWAWRQILRAIVAEREPETLRRELGARAARIGQIVPELRERLHEVPARSREPPEAARFELFDATAGFLRHVAEPRGLVLHIDDLHVGDEGSVALFGFVARELDGARILLVGGHRDAEAERSPALDALLADTARLADSTRIALAGLAPEAVRALVTELAEGDPSDDLIDIAQRRTEGNPFLIRELVAYAVRHGAAALAELADGAVPDTVREIARARLRGLSPNCRAALEAASVIGREFPIELVARVLSKSLSEVEEAIDEAARHAVVVDAERGRSRFVHVLLRDALYGGQRASRRAEAHRRVGEALEGLSGADPDALATELAHHFALAGPRCRRKAIDHAIRAGRHALADFAFDDAAAHFEHALASLEGEPGASPVERCDLLLELGEARMLQNRRDSQRDAFRRAAMLAAELRDAERLARAAYGFVDRTLVAEADAEGARLLVDALAALPREDTQIRIVLLARLAHLSQSLGEGERSDACLREALERSGRIDDPEARAELAQMRFNLELAHAARPERLRQLALEGVRLAEQIGDRRRLVTFRILLAEALAKAGDRAAADREVAAASPEARIDSFVFWRVSEYRTMNLLAAGALADVEASIAERLVKQNTRLRLFGEGGLTLVQLSALRREQDRLAEIWPEVENALGSEPSPILRAFRATFLIELGRDDDARRELERFTAEDFVSGGPPQVISALLVEVCASLRDAAHADVLFDVLAPHADDQVIAGSLAVALGPTARYLGLLHLLRGRFDAAQRCLVEARARCRAMGWPLLERYAELDEAKLRLARRARGDRERAHHAAGAILAEAHERGLARLARHAEALLSHSAEGRQRLRAL